MNWDGLRSVWSRVSIDLPLEEVPVLTSAMFVPRGTTALLDAMGRTIGALGEELAGMAE